MTGILTTSSDTLRQLVHPVDGGARDWDPLLTLAHDARVVVIGVESAGAHELLHDRICMTRRLIEVLGFGTVAVDSDFGAVARIDRYIHGAGEDPTAEEAFRGFRRFPSWRMRNCDVVNFVGWLRNHNEGAPRAPVAMCGLDAAGLYSSIDMILAYLDAEDPVGAAQARSKFGRLEQFSSGDQSETDLELARSRTDLLVREIGALQCRNAGTSELAESMVAELEAFDRELLHGRRSALIHRNRIMARAAAAIAGAHRRVVIWTSNVNAGDARATRHGWDVTLGSELREQFGEECVLIALTAYSGSVVAATRWGGKAERIRLLPSLPESWEAILYEADCPAFLMTLRDKAGVTALTERRPERSIGAVYQPETERWSHYLEASLAEQFDAVVHHDRVLPAEPV